jgi:hypothetical protein
LRFYLINVLVMRTAEKDEVAERVALFVGHFRLVARPGLVKCSDMCNLEIEDWLVLYENDDIDPAVRPVSLCQPDQAPVIMRV